MMKKIYILILTAVMCSCADNTTTTTKKSGEAKQRIIGKEYTLYEGIGYQIIEIDGVEYLSNTAGGMCVIPR